MRGITCSQFGVLATWQGRLLFSLTIHSQDLPPHLPWSGTSSRNLMFYWKVNVCVWRLCNNFTLTRANLTRRHITSDPSCVMFNSHEESVIHLSRFCLFAKCEWLASNLGVLLRDLNSPALMDWIIDMANRLSLRNFELALMILWAIWSARNQKFWSDTWDNPAMVVTQCITWWQEFLRTRATQYKCIP